MVQALNMSQLEYQCVLQKPLNSCSKDVWQKLDSPKTFMGREPNVLETFTLIHKTHVEN
jgi:hypothetical protein